MKTLGLKQNGKVGFSSASALARRPRLPGLGSLSPSSNSCPWRPELLASFPALGRAGKTTARNFGWLCSSVRGKKKAKKKKTQGEGSRYSSSVPDRAERTDLGVGAGRGGHNSVRFKCACVRGVAPAFIERPLCTAGRGVWSARARPGLGARGPCARVAGGVSPRLAGWLAGRLAASGSVRSLPGRGNPGRVVAAAAYVSAVSRRGRAGRPGGREGGGGGRRRSAGAAPVAGRAAAAAGSRAVRASGRPR